jgi:DNA polymerase-1
VLEFAESRGVEVDSFCKRHRVWVEGQAAEDGRSRIVLPGNGRTDSQFASEVGGQIKAKNVWFNHNHRAVVIRPVEITEKLKTVGFHALKPIEAGTDLEQYIETGLLRQDGAGNPTFHPSSLTREGADKLLHATQLLSRLPRILRIMDAPLPVLHKGEICLPQPGYNPDLKAYLLPSAPQIKTVPIEEARRLIQAMLEEFCFESDQALVHAVARLLTPFCKGLMGWDARPPLWVYEANRERCGKDYLNGTIQIIHDGNIVSNPPFNSDEELRKKITAALRSGVRRMHFANMKGHISSGALEEAVTNKVWNDRTLGHSEERSYPNEIDFSLSCNIGTTWTPDLGNRMRIISLFLAQEDPNDRRFKYPDLHGWVRPRRGEILSALFTLVQYWDKSGRPDGPTLFASFPEWARVVGGIMYTGELGDPCLPDQRATKVGGDEMTGDMKDLFALAHEEFGEEWVKKEQIYQLLEGRTDLGLFSWLDLSERSGKTRFGKALHRYDKRILGDVVLAVEGNKNTRRYKFFRDGGAEGQPVAAFSLLGARGTSGTSSVVKSADSGKTSSETATQPPITPPEEEHKEHKELVTPYETLNLNNYGGSDNTINYLGSKYDSGEDVPDVPYVPLEEDDRLITKKSELGKIAEAILKAGCPVALDIETYTDGKGGALNPFKPGHIRLLTLAIPDHDPWLIDLRAIEDDLGKLGKTLGQVEILAHNAKFDLQWLRQRCGLILPKVFCTMTASKLLTTGDHEAKNNLKTCLSRWLDIDLPKDQGKSDWGSMMLMPEQLEYAANDVAHLHALKEKLQVAIVEAGLKEVCELEMKLLPVVVDIEARGFAVNREMLESIGEECRQRSLPLEAQLHDLFGNPINLESPKQLKEAFKGIGVNIPNTSASTMANTDHEAARLLLGYREVIKQRQQVETLLKATGSNDRIHGRFDPTATDTGRFSSSSPNMQSIGRGEIRRAFIAASGCQLVIADYSQIELRAAAVIAKDETMLAAYQSGEDIHARTAASILGKPIKQVTKQDRQLAKAVNFGLLYGQSPRGLVKYAKSGFEVDLTYNEAVSLHEKFFGTYQGLKRWHEEARSKAGSAVNEVRTLFGRRKLLPPHNEETFWSRFSAGFLNMVVQGTCADGLKHAMVHLADKLPDEAQMVGTIHDELIVECPADSAKEVCQLTEEVMREAMFSVLGSEVPVEVEAKVCECWEEK